MLRVANDHAPIAAGEVVVIPKRWDNPAGVTSELYQVVPILTYHHFGSSRDRMSVTPENFRQQLAYLRDNGYHVVPLADLREFVAGRKALPPKSVVISIDDGYQSTYREAFPLLLEFGFPATVFVYSDFLNGGGLKGPQMQEMLQSGLIDFQPHSKTHRNMALMAADEDVEQYQARVRAELQAPQAKLRDLIGTPGDAFAFPYGATTREVLALLASSDYRIAATVERGSNAFFAHPFLLKRSMIYHEHSLEDFIQNLVVEERY